MIHHISTPRFDSKHGVDVFVFGDRQQGPDDQDGKPSGGYLREAWQEFRREFKASPNPYGLGLGDYGDFLRPTMRHALAGALGKDDSAKQMVDNMVLKAHDKILDEMQFLERRLIGIHEGHHNHGFMNGTNTDQRLAAALRAPYLGWSASTRLVLKLRPDSVGRSHVVTIISTHGNANGRKVPTALSWMENNFAASWIADVYAMGHGCKSANMAPFERQTVRREGPAGVSRSIPRILVVGGFTRAYTDGWRSDYVERNGMAQQPISWGIIRLRPVWNKTAMLAKGVKSGRSGTLTIDIEAANRFFQERDA